MKKALFFAASFCLFLAGLHSTAWAAQQEVFNVKLNVPSGIAPLATLNFTAVTDKYGRMQELTTKFNNDVYHINYEQLRSGDTTPISYSGTQIVSVQGFGMNQLGEGTVRLTIEQKFMGPGVNPVMDLELRQLGPDKKWLTLVNRKAATGAVLNLNLDPAQQSMFSLMMSPPQIVRSSVVYVGCSDAALDDGVKNYGADYAKRAGCSSSAAR